MLSKAWTVEPVDDLKNNGFLENLSNECFPNHQLFIEYKNLMILRQGYNKRGNRYIK